MSDDYYEELWEDLGDGPTYDEYIESLLESKMNSLCRM